MAFSWSHSGLKAFENCPYKFQQTYLLKRFKDSSEHLDRGIEMHRMLENAVKYGVALPKEYAKYQYLIEEAHRGGGELLIEQQMAITNDFQPCEYFGSKAWYRCKIDAMRIAHDIARVRDYKTGKIGGKEGVDYSQLMLQAACVFIFYPEVHHIHTEFVWLDHMNEDGRCPMTVAMFHRKDMPTSWIGILNRVQRMELAAKTGNYPKSPSGLCRAHCPVTDCEHNGRRK